MLNLLTNAVKMCVPFNVSISSSLMRFAKIKMHGFILDIDGVILSKHPAFSCVSSILACNTALVSSTNAVEDYQMSASSAQVTDSNHYPPWKGRIGVVNTGSMELAGYLPGSITPDNWLQVILQKCYTCILFGTNQ